MSLTFLLTPIAMFVVADDDSAKDREKLRGTWVFVSSERGGRDEGVKELAEKGGPLKLTFADETFRFHLPAGAARPQSYRLDAAAKPHMIDWSNVRGIYELDGDKLTVCWGQPNGGRPTKFASTPDGGEWLWVLKREKAER
jgi:uncharacterized protein (TIGR03067 family)